MQGGAEWALARHDQLALGLSDIPQAARQRDGTPAGRARAALALTTLPKHLPCRDAERTQIAQFLEDVLCPGARPRTSCSRSVSVLVTSPWHDLLTRSQGRRQVESGSMSRKATPTRRVVRADAAGTRA